MDFTLKITEYPNNEVRAVLYRVKGSNPHDSGGDALCDASGGDSDSLAAPAAPAAPVSGPLDIRSEVSGKGTTVLRPGYGGAPKPTRFGLAAKRQIQRCAGVFDRDAIPREECLFLTGTIPGGTEAAFGAVACWSAWIVKRVKTWLGEQGCSGQFSLYCWELQRRGALHLHYLVWVPEEEVRQRILWRWTIRWAALLDEVGSRSACDCWERKKGGTWASRKGVLQAPAQVVRKGVGAYLSKYCSKGANSPTLAESVGKFPTRWWGVSRALLSRCQSLTNSFVVEGVAFSRVRYLWEGVVREFRGFAGGFREFSDKLGWAQIAVGYGSDAPLIFHYLWRDFHVRYSI